MIVSGFLSPGEKELLRCLKAEPRARFVKTLPYALPSRYDPSAEDSREIAAEFTELKALGNLAPGDFRTVRQESFYLGETVSTRISSPRSARKAATRRTGNGRR